MKWKLQVDKRNKHYFIRIRRDGVPKYFRFGTDKKLAQKEMKQVERDIASGKITFVEQDTSAITRPDGSKDMRIEELAYRHLEWVKANRSPGTVANREFFLKRFLGFIGERMVSQISRIMLEEFYASEKNKTKRPNAGFEAMRHVRTLLRWGEETELIELTFKRFPRMSYVPPETRRVESDELALLLPHAPQDFRDFIMFGLLTGLRPYEMRTLRQDHIRHDGQGTSYLFIERDVKGAKMTRIPKPRSVPLCKEAEAIIERQVKAHPRSQFIFLNEDGTPYTRYTLRDRFRRLAKLCGVENVIPYGLRHTFASLQAVGGTETNSLAQLMGHSSTRTLQRYVSNTAKEHKEAMDRNEKRLMAMLGEANVDMTVEPKVGEKLPPICHRENPKGCETNPSLSVSTSPAVV
jgi:integrase